MKYLLLLLLLTGCQTVPKQVVNGKDMGIMVFCKEMFPTDFKDCSKLLMDRDQRRTLVCAFSHDC